MVDCLGNNYVGWEAVPGVNHSLREVFTEVEIFSQPFLENLLVCTVVLTTENILASISSKPLRILKVSMRSPLTLLTTSG